MGILLSIRNLETSFYTGDGVVKAVNGIDLDIQDGRIVGLIGETGCGKSVLGLSILRLLPRNAEIRGKVFYKGQDILKLTEEEIRRLRGKEVALIPQNPSTSLNPVLKIGTQIAESLQLHRRLPREKAWGAAVDILRSLDLPNPEKRAEEYPHQLSGGMKQRVLAAVGIAGEPSLLIADEPTKGLDALIRVQVVEVLRRLVLQTGAAMLIITHDLKVAAGLCDELAVMYAGEIIEYGPAEQLLSSPEHPYARGLIASLPGNGLKPIEGFSPSLINLPAGCKFHPRCPFAIKACTEEHPRLVEIEEGHRVRCLLVDQSREPEKDLFNWNLQKEVG